MKNLLPYELTCAVARLINRPFLEQESRCERIVEYAWVLNNMRPGRTLDFGYAGSYFARALCLFGPVHGVDLRHTPKIAHPQFIHFTSIPMVQYDNIVCVSVLEHHLDVRHWIKEFLQHLKPDGQILMTFPTGDGRVFQGYREVARDLLPGNAQWHEVGSGPNTEHKVNHLALVRLTHPTDQPPPTA